jgi:hypothetical protein
MVRPLHQGLSYLIGKKLFEYILKSSVKFPVKGNNWRGVNYNHRCQGVGGINNVCLTGWRFLTVDECLEE